MIKNRFWKWLYTSI